MDDELLKAFSTLLDEKLEPIKNNIKLLESKIIELKTLKEENYQVSKLLEHKSEHDRFNNEISILTEEIHNIRKDLSTVEIVTARNWQYIAHQKTVK